MQRVTRLQASAAAATMCRWRAQLQADSAQTAAANSVEPRAPTVVEFPIDDSDPTPSPDNIDLGVEMVRQMFAEEGSAAW